jgi:pimeloyl-ACP methyl ester carboxylesterase
MTQALAGHRLDVPGGRLHYEVRGSGPLLLIVGQPMTSEPFGPLADLFANRYTVVTYDPHGLGRSSIDDPTLDVTADVEGDDLAHLIDAVGGGPVDIFGSSGGATAGLALSARHPDRVRTLVAHEPPVTDLLPDGAAIRAVTDDVAETYRSSGSGAAWGKFVSLVMHDGPVLDEGVPPAAWPPGGADTGQDASEPPTPSPKQQADDALFFLRMLRPITRYQPDVDALRSGRPRIVIGVGEASRQEIARRSAEALAERLGVTPVVFPGGHGGFTEDTESFARTLSRVLEETA